jgi:DNA-binding PadR family transcriptional regulator
VPKATPLRRVDILYNVCSMSGSPVPAFETAVLLAVARLADEAYGAAVQREVGARGGREYAVGAIHTALQRLEDKGLVTSRMGEPLPVRGGRARRYYRLTAAGAQALEQARTAARRLWQSPELGLEPS